MIQLLNLCTISSNLLFIWTWGVYNSYQYVFRKSPCIAYQMKLMTEINVGNNVIGTHKIKTQLAFSIASEIVEICGPRIKIYCSTNTCLLRMFSVGGLSENTKKQEILLPVEVFHPFWETRLLYSRTFALIVDKQTKHRINFSIFIYIRSLDFKCLKCNV